MTPFCFSRLSLALPVLAISCGAPSYRYASAPVTRSSSPPGWALAGESREHPRDQYVIGVGRATSQQGADDAARAEIAKVFEVVVRQATEETSTYGEAATSRGYSGWDKALHMQQATRSETEKVLSGVEIVARECSGDADFYSLAALSRRKAAEGLQERAQAAADRADDLWRRGREDADPLKAARAMYQAAIALTRLEAVNADLRVLGVRKPVPAPVQTAQVLGAFADRLRKDLKFSVAFQGDDSDRLKEAVQSALSSRGVVVTDSERAKVEISGVCSLKVNKRPPTDWFFVRFDLTLAAINLDSGNVVASVGPVTDDASALTEPQAFERASFVLRTRHVEPFVTMLFERLFGEVQVQVK